MIPEKLFETEECQLFLSVLPNQNFMSPHVLDYIRIGDYVVELSTDHTQTSATKLVGVTVVNVVTKEHCTNLCDCFIGTSYTGAMNQATEYINQLKQKYANG